QALQGPAVDLFADGPVLRNETAAGADPPRPSNQSGTFELCDLENRRRALCSAFRRRLGHVSTSQCDWAAQRLRSSTDLFSALVSRQVVLRDRSTTRLLLCRGPRERRRASDRWEG